MRIAVLGTGTVGQTLAAKLSWLGHDVVVGTRDVAATPKHVGRRPTPVLRRFDRPDRTEELLAGPRCRHERDDLDLQVTERSRLLRGR